MNDYRRRHWAKRAEHEQEWRTAGFGLGAESLPRGLERISLVVTPYGPGARQDPGNCYPSVKAFIDGLVDARVIADDDGEHVAYITLKPWVHKTSETALHFLITEEPRAENPDSR